MGTMSKGVLSALCGLALAASAPAAATGAAGVAWQVGSAVLCEAVAGLAGYGLMYQALGGANDSDNTYSGNAGGVFIGLSLFAAYPLAASAGTYFVGEKVGDPSANKGAAFGTTTFFAYAQTFLFVGAAATVRAVDDDIGEEAYAWALVVDAATKPVLTTYVYHKVKKPASPADSRLAVEPYVCAAAASDGKSVPVYGVTLNF
jgi:hypothetical protein